jgi:hypothetical protein
MRFVLLVVLAVLAFQAGAAPQDARPTEDSVNRLFEVMHTSQFLDNYLAQVDTMMRSSMRQALHGEQLNAEEQQIMEDMSSELASLVRHEVSWESMRPVMVEVYRNTFSQHEVDDMLKFYRSPSGQAVVAKLPAATQQATQTMQQHVSTLMPKIMQLQRDTVAALKRAQERAASSSAQSASPPQPSPPQPSPPPPSQTSPTPR